MPLEKPSTPFSGHFENVPEWCRLLETFKGIKIEEKERFKNREGNEVIMFEGSDNFYYLLLSEDNGGKNLFMASFPSYDSAVKDAKIHLKIT